MSLHQSFKRGGGLLHGHKNVLPRVERIERLLKSEKWKEGDSIFGLPKVGNIKPKGGKKKKKGPEEQEESAEK